MTRRTAALACGAALLLAGCAELLPRSIVLSEAELQAQLAKRFPVERSVLDLYDLKLSEPQLRLDGSSGRLSTELALQASERRTGRAVQGRLALDYGLRYDPADASVRLVQPRVQSLQFDGEAALPGRRAEMLRSMGVPLAERLLDGLVLYRVPPQRLERLRSAGVQPGTLQVTPAGVEITLEPVKP